jgi:hypothetical protein
MLHLYLGRDFYKAVSKLEYKLRIASRQVPPGSAPALLALCSSDSLPLFLVSFIQQTYYYLQYARKKAPPEIYFVYLC